PGGPALHRRPRPAGRSGGGRWPSHRAFPPHLTSLSGELRRPDGQGDQTPGRSRAGSRIGGGAPGGPLRPGRAAPADQPVESQEGVTDPARALAGRREAELLELPSVRRMADSLGRRCREASWIRTLVSALDRFRTMTGNEDLEDLAATARRDVAAAEGALL